MDMKICALSSLSVFSLPRSDGASSINLSHHVCVCERVFVCDTEQSSREETQLKSSSSYNTSLPQARVPHLFVCDGQ